MSTSAENKIDLVQAQKDLNEIIKDQRSAINSTKEAISNSSEMQRQADPIDTSYGTTEMQLNTSLIRKAEQTILACQASLQYIRDKEYGLCRSCWDEIEVSRLKTAPYLTHCSSCSQDQALVGRHVAQAR